MPSRWLRKSGSQPATAHSFPNKKQDEAKEHCGRAS
jgi:hypothetical protein